MSTLCEKGEIKLSNCVYILGILEMQSLVSQEYASKITINSFSFYCFWFQVNAAEETANDLPVRQDILIKAM